MLVNYNVGSDKISYWILPTFPKIYLFETVFLGKLMFIREKVTLVLITFRGNCTSKGGAKLTMCSQQTRR